MAAVKPIEGSCACGQINFQVAGPPQMQLYCHCKQCRQYHCAPFMACCVFKPQDLKITKGSDSLFKVNNTQTVTRFSCNTCRSPIYSAGNESWPMIGVYPNLLKDFEFQAQMHIQCANAVFPLEAIKDGLPQLPEFPSYG